MRSDQVINPDQIKLWLENLTESPKTNLEQIPHGIFQEALNLVKLLYEEIVYIDSLIHLAESDIFTTIDKLEKYGLTKLDPEQGQSSYRKNERDLLVQLSRIIKLKIERNQSIEFVRAEIIGENIIQIKQLIVARQGGHLKAINGLVNKYEQLEPWIIALYAYIKNNHE